MNEEMKKLMDELSGQLEGIEKGIKAAVEDGDVETKKALESQIEGIAKRLDDMEAKAQRQTPGGENPEAQQPNLEAKAAFNKFLRQGAENMSLEEKGIMTVSDDTTGGYLAPEEMVNEIIKDPEEVTPMRMVAGIRTTSMKSVILPKRKTTPTALWKGETESAEDTNSTYGLERVTPEKLTAIVRVSQEDLEDSAFDLEGEIISDAREQFAKAEGVAFVSGDGVNKPDGFLNDPDITEITSAASGVLDGDDLLDLFYAVKTTYSNVGSYMMNRNTIGVVRKLKDNQGQYLFSPAGTFADQPYSTVNNKRVFEAPDMPDIAVGAKPVAFGDWRRGYKIVDRKDITILRDMFTQAAEGVIRFIIHKRVGGKVVQPEALAILKIKA